MENSHTIKKKALSISDNFGIIKNKSLKAMPNKKKKSLHNINKYFEINVTYSEKKNQDTIEKISAVYLSKRMRV